MSAAGAQKLIGGDVGAWVGGGAELISKNRRSHHKYRSPKQFV